MELFGKTADVIGIVIGAGHLEADGDKFFAFEKFGGESSHEAEGIFVVSEFGGTINGGGDLFPGGWLGF